MARHRGPVLVDTNVILECWRIGSWKALSSGYAVETVEDCVIETQTGYQRRRAEQQIDRAALVASLAAVHKVSDTARAGAAVREPLFAYLDPGEASLGHMRSRAMMPGYCAALTPRACVSACASAFAIASWHSKIYCMMWGIGQLAHSGATTRPAG
jgi:hypothetical protein